MKIKMCVVVSHKATIRLIMSSLLGFDERGYRDRLDQAPACLNILDFKDICPRPIDALQRYLALRRSPSPRRETSLPLVGLQVTTRKMETDVTVAGLVMRKCPL